MKCDDCGVELQVGDWPFCPHGQYGNATGAWKGMVDDVQFETKREFSGRGDFERYLKRNKMEPRNPSFKKSDKGRWV